MTDFAPELDDEDRAHFLDRILVSTGDLAGRVELYERPDAAGGMWSADYVLSVTYTALGDRPRARPHLMAMVEAGRESTSPLAKADSAVALALLGEHAAAQRAADEAVQLLPVSRDMVNGPRVAIARAWVLIKTHERAEEGYAELERLLGAWGLWPRYVALLPEWRMLTDDPRVQQLFREAISKSGKQGP